MARRFEAYAVKRNDNLGDPDFWNKRLEDIDLRLAARELDGDKIAGAVDELTSVALARLNDTFTPVINEAIERLNSVGALFSSTSDSAATIGAGFKTFLLDASTRAGFVVPEFVGIRPAGLSDRGMIAQVSAYDRATGLLDVEVVLFSGAGAYDDWVIRITGAPDVEHSTRTDNPHETTAAQVGAYTTGQTDTLVAGAVASEATARTGAITAAINTLKGGVSAAYDTLIEIAAKLTDNDSVVGGIMTSLGNRLRIDVDQLLNSAQQKRARANAGVADGNIVINGDFRINQRVQASGAPLAASNYGHDRWKAGAGGCTYVFGAGIASSLTIQINAGTLLQIVEDRNVEGGSYVLSWAGSAQARIGINTAGPSGGFASSPIVVTGQNAGTVMSIEFGTGTLGKVKLEPGSVPTPFISGDIQSEFTKCLRYCEFVGTGAAYGISGYLAGTNVGRFGFQFKSVKRNLPSLISVPSSLNINWQSGNSAGIGVSLQAVSLNGGCIDVVVSGSPFTVGAGACLGIPDGALIFNAEL